MQSLRVLQIFVTVLSFNLRAACAGDTIRDATRGVTITVPDGFTRAPELESADYFLAFKRMPGAGELSKKADLRALLSVVVQGVDGKTNWLTTDERWDRLFSAATRMGTCLAIFGGIIAIVVTAIVKSRRARKLRLAESMDD